jgi:hypothetical protein
MKSLRDTFYMILRMNTRAVLLKTFLVFILFHFILMHNYIELGFAVLGLRGSLDSRGSRDV